MSEPLHQLDDLDPKAYAFAVVNPYWMGNLEQRVRYVLQSTGFEITRMLTNPDDSMVTFWLRLGPWAQFENVAEAHATLRQALIAAGCPCTNDQLVLWFQNGGWHGAYVPIPPEDNVDPMIYVNALPPYA